MCIHHQLQKVFELLRCTWWIWKSSQLTSLRIGAHVSLKRFINLHHSCSVTNFNMPTSNMHASKSSRGETFVQDKVLHCQLNLWKTQLPNCEWSGTGMIKAQLHNCSALYHRCSNMFYMLTCICKSQHWSSEKSLCMQPHALLIVVLSQTLNCKVESVLNLKLLCCVHPCP